ncbi:hypothetical protein EYF80_036857 [Liparis tanakae]|uniref:Uncharacterized protein n=1 Tax=Liparis tanakae TaxID=230148 RepID=A0A4Z2GHR7_9TELE|nr:hypothetical protein EYF80_036857 [Liparis tanakae]
MPSPWKESVKENFGRIEKAGKAEAPSNESIEHKLEEDMTAGLNTCCTSSWVSVGFFRNNLTMALKARATLSWKLSKAATLQTHDSTVAVHCRLRGRGFCLAHGSTLGSTAAVTLQPNRPYLSLTRCFDTCTHLNFDGTAANGSDRFAYKVHVHLSGVLLQLSQDLQRDGRALVSLGGFCDQYLCFSKITRIQGVLQLWLTGVGMREGLFSGLLSVRGLILLLSLFWEKGPTLSAFFGPFLVCSPSPLLSPLARGEDGGGDSERDSLRLKHMEEFSLEESWKEQSSEGGRGTGRTRNISFGPCAPAKLTLLTCQPPSGRKTSTVSVQIPTRHSWGSARRSDSLLGIGQKLGLKAAVQVLLLLGVQGRQLLETEARSFLFRRLALQARPAPMVAPHSGAGAL